MSGNASLLFDSTDAAITVQGNIYGGGGSVVYGDSIITFTGIGANLSIGVVSSDGYIAGTVLGTKYLVFDDFTGDFITTTTDFDVISFTGDTVMNYTGNCDLMALDDFDVLEGLTVEIYKNDDLLGSFEWGGSYENYSLLNDDGILALVS